MHNKEKHGNNLFACNECGKPCQTLYLSLNCCKTFICEICKNSKRSLNYVFNNTKSYKLHQSNSHTPKKDEKVNCQKKSCQLEFNTKFEMQEHFYEKHCPFPCPHLECKYRGTTRPVLDVHIINKHPELNEK